MEAVDTILDMVTGTQKMASIWTLSIAGLLLLLSLLLVSLMKVYHVARSRSRQRHHNYDPPPSDSQDTDSIHHTYKLGVYFTSC